MKVVGTLKRRFGSAEAPPQFECGLCAMRFERQPTNCPACGNTEIREI